MQSQICKLMNLSSDRRNWQSPVTQLSAKSKSLFWRCFNLLVHSIILTLISSPSLFGPFGTRGGDRSAHEPFPFSWTPGGSDLLKNRLSVWSGDHWVGQNRLIVIRGDPYKWGQSSLWAPKCKKKTFFSNSNILGNMWLRTLGTWATTRWATVNLGHQEIGQLGNLGPSSRWPKFARPFPTYLTYI